MNHAIRVSETGGPEVMQWESVEVPSPGPSEILLRHTAVGTQLHRCLFQKRRVSRAAVAVHART